ncbi:hypothetical protein QUF75_01000 [Desulfococcaceae bacterium HSG7]|nr:hypothetical protein [Desulfococcaceae bacterium HSG7]
METGLEKQGRMALLLVQVEDPLSLKPDSAELPRMLFGSYVRVENEGREIALAAAIKREYIRNSSSVWVMDAKGCLAVRSVEIAFRGTDQFLVTGGINPEEQLVITDLAAPVSGMPLRTTNDTTEQTSRKSRAGKEGQS